MSETPLSKPDHQRPEMPDFWDKRFAEGVTPWDQGGVPAELASLLPPPGAGGRPRILVPGCGHAREAAWLDARGWAVTAVDFSPAAVAVAREMLGEWGGHLHCGDFFDLSQEEPFDVVYERAFLCALPRKLWSGYGEKMAELLRPGGFLAGFYYFDAAPKGPPFGIAPAEQEGLLSPYFDRLADAPAAQSVPIFAGKERWQLWLRR